ncbi:MAG: type IX secretion system membrane protein PorP/SprF, partial [Cytophagales bacterium]|nr:type IX secretion system membrane protein PorP/SprF [Cytophagales bacterium]
MITFSWGNAQQREYFYNQYFQHPQIVNPAFTGVNQAWELKLGFRKSISKLEVEPNNLFMGVNGAFMDKRSLARAKTKYSEEIPAVYSIMFRKPYQGVGGFIFNRKAGGFVHLVGGGTFSYFNPLTKKWAISA